MKTGYIKIFLIFISILLPAAVVFGAEKDDIAAQIEALEKKVQHAKDIMQIRNLMMQVQNHIDWTSQNVQKTPGQCFGQNDGYMYGSFLKRAGAAPQGGGMPDGSGGEAGSQGGGQGGPPSSAQGGGGQAGSPPQGGMPEGAPDGGMPADTGGQGGPPGGMGGMGGGGQVGIDYHTCPSGVVEVAEDGMTAKGIWYSPGTLTEGGSMTAWIFETYAMDFAKEDGVWRLWRRTLSTDFMVAPEKSWTETWTASGDTDVARISAIIDATKDGEYDDEARQRNVQGDGQDGAPGMQAGSPGGQGGAPPQGGISGGTGGQGGPPGGQGGAPGGGGQDSGTKDIRTVTYQSWTATTVPQFKPVPPFPYETFDETFSYCPPEPEDLDIDESLMF